MPALKQWLTSPWKGPHWETNQARPRHFLPELCRRLCPDSCETASGRWKDQSDFFSGRTPGCDSWWVHCCTTSEPTDNHQSRRPWRKRGGLSSIYGSPPTPLSFSLSFLSFFHSFFLTGCFHVRAFYSSSKNDRHLLRPLLHIQVRLNLRECATGIRD